MPPSGKKHPTLPGEEAPARRSFGDASWLDVLVVLLILAILAALILPAAFG